MKHAEPAADTSAERFLATHRSSINSLPSRPRPSTLNVRLMTSEEATDLTTKDGCFSRESDYRTDASKLRRLSSLATSGLVALGREETDHATYSTSVSILDANGSSTTAHFALYDPSTRIPTSKWKNGTMVKITMKDRTQPVFAIVRNASLDQADDSLHVKISASGNSGALLQAYVAAKSSACTVRQIVESSKSNPAEALLSTHASLLEHNWIDPDGRASKILAALYGGVPIPHPPANSDPIVIRYKGRELSLLEEQSRAVHAAVSADLPAMIVSSSFGCGKTLLSCAIACKNAARLDDNDQDHKLTVLLASSNLAVVNAVQTASQLDGISDNLVRMISESNWRTQAARSPFDLPALIREVLEARKHELPEDKQKIASNYLHELERLDTIDFTGPEDDLEESIKMLTIRDEGNSTSVEQVIDIFWDLYKPRTMMTTVSSFLLAFGPNGSLKSRHRHVDLVILDEASQIADCTTTCVLGLVPEARMVFVGDVKQLRPYSAFTKSAWLPFLASDSLLGRTLGTQCVPMFPLTSVFRSHPSVTDLLSRTFYDGTLVAVPSAQERMGLLRAINLPNPREPWAFINVYGNQQTSTTGSWINFQEVDMCVFIVKTLLRNGLYGEDIGVITAYKAQADELSAALADTTVQAHTIDSSQGKEFKVTVFSTVRTAAEETDLSFLCDPHRVNVALSRASHGVLIVGNIQLLKDVSCWKAIVKEIECRDAVCEADQFKEKNEPQHGH